MGRIFDAAFNEHLPLRYPGHLETEDQQPAPDFDAVKQRLRAALPKAFAYDALRREGETGYVSRSLKSGFIDTDY